MMSIKGHNSVTNMQKMMCNNPNLDVVNINKYTKFGEILSFCAQNIEQNRNSEWNSDSKGHNSMTNVWKMMCNNPNLDLVNIIAYT